MIIRWLKAILKHNKKVQKIPHGSPGYVSDEFIKRANRAMLKSLHLGIFKKEADELSRKLGHRK
jgi:hypothetical protein